MKRSLVLAIVLSLILMSIAGCGNPATPEAPETPDKNPVVKIGVFEPASGDNGAGGKQETLGIQYAHYVQPTVEIGGKTYDVELVIVDNESANEKAATAASTLVDAGVSVVLGSYGSGVSIAGGPTFKAANIPVVGVTCTNPAVTQGNTYYFRICFLDPFQGTVLANYAFNELKATKAYTVKLGDDYSGGLVKYFVEAFKKLGRMRRGDIPRGHRRLRIVCD